MNRSIAGLILLASTLCLASCQSSVLAPTTATVRGTVIGGGTISVFMPPTGGQPLADFTVIIAGKSATTAADGSYILFNVDVGTQAYEVQSPSGYVCRSGSIDVVAPETVRDSHFIDPSQIGFAGIHCEQITCSLSDPEWLDECLP